MRDLDVGPRQPLAIDDEKRLNGIAALERLDGTIFGDECFVLGTVRADDGPVTLLAEEVARVGAALRVLGDDRIERVLRRRPLRWLRRHAACFADNARYFRRCVGQPDEKLVRDSLLQRTQRDDAAT